MKEDKKNKEDSNSDLLIKAILGLATFGIGLYLILS